MGLSPARLLVRCGGGGHSVNLACSDVTDRRWEDKGDDAQLESKSTQAAKQMMEEYYFTFLPIGESFRIRVSFLLRGVSTPIALRTFFSQRRARPRESGGIFQGPFVVPPMGHSGPAQKRKEEKKREKNEGPTLCNPPSPSSCIYNMPPCYLSPPLLFFLHPLFGSSTLLYFGSSRPLRRPPVACCRTLLPPLFPGHCMEKRNCRAEGAATTF